MERNCINECWSCTNKIEVPGNAHIRCAKPDDNMRGMQHGIEQGCFDYPALFDPVWKIVMCKNYETISVDKGCKESCPEINE